MCLGPVITYLLIVLYLKAWAIILFSIIAVTLRGPARFAPDSTLNSKVSLWRGDITSLEIDAIVNAANSSLMGRGDVDRAIHRAASGSLKTEYRSLGRGRAGETKITGGHRLPAKCKLLLLCVCV